MELGRCKGSSRDPAGGDAGPRGRRRLADPRSEPGGLASRAGAWARGTDTSPRREATGGQWSRGSRAPGKWLSAGAAWSLRSLDAEVEGPEAPRLRGCNNERNNSDLPTCWESSVLGFPACGVGVVLKLELVVRVVAGASRTSVVCGRLAAAFALLLRLAGEVTPELRREPCLAQEELGLAGCGLSYHSISRVVDSL